jgi:hypothetical protein
LKYVDCTEAARAAGSTGRRLRRSTSSKTVSPSEPCVLPIPLTCAATFALHSPEKNRRPRAP